MSLHWIRHTSLTQWLSEHPTLLQPEDNLLLTDSALQQLPAEKPVSHPLFALAAEATEASTSVPPYVEWIDDAAWVELVLNCPQQITW